jgi:hypothetical protein
MRISTPARVGIAAVLLLVLIGCAIQWHRLNLAACYGEILACPPAWWAWTTLMFSGVLCLALLSGSPRKEVQWLLLALACFTTGVVVALTPIQMGTHAIIAP